MALDNQLPLIAPVIPITETVIFPGIKNRIYVTETVGRNIQKYIGEANSLAVGVSTKEDVLPHRRFAAL